MTIEELRKDVERALRADNDHDYSYHASQVESAVRIIVDYLANRDAARVYKSTIVKHQLRAKPGFIDGEIVRLCTRCGLFVNDAGGIDVSRYSEEFVRKYLAAPEELKCKHVM